MIRQIIPEDYCLNCRLCCRFKEEDSAWLPCLLDEETQGLLDKKGLPAWALSQGRKILPVADGQGRFLCPFLKPQENNCSIYAGRPFECQLYPFLLALRGSRVFLTVDLNCPFVQENLNSAAFREFTEYLSRFLNSPEQKRMIKDNPQLLQAYEGIREIIELSLQ